MLTVRSLSGLRLQDTLEVTSEENAGVRGRGKTSGVRVVVGAQDGVHVAGLEVLAPLLDGALLTERVGKCLTASNGAGLDTAGLESVRTVGDGALSIAQELSTLCDVVALVGTRVSKGSGAQKRESEEERGELHVDDVEMLRY
jgi:hypothetical protein